MPTAVRSSLCSRVLTSAGVFAITILYKNTKVNVRSPDGDTDYFDIVAGVLRRDTLAPDLFIKKNRNIPQGYRNWI